MRTPVAPISHLTTPIIRLPSSLSRRRRSRRGPSALLSAAERRLPGRPSLPAVAERRLPGRRDAGARSGKVAAAERGARRGGALLAAGGAGAALAYLLDPSNGRRRRHMLRDRTVSIGRRAVRRTARRADYTAGHVRGAAHQAHTLVEHTHRDHDDVTIARMVESALFRTDHAIKGMVNVNARHGVVELRGQLPDPAQIVELGEIAGRVEGVASVVNLLHTPDEPVKHAPPAGLGDAG